MKRGRVIQALEHAVKQDPYERYVSIPVLREALRLIRNNRMSDANTRQHGGNHYQSGLQHWDVMGDNYGIAYHIGCATKYVSRWKKKGTPILDLEKAVHFVDKAKELWIAGRRGETVYVPTDVIERFVIANDLEMQERVVLLNLWRCDSLSCLERAKFAIEALIREAQHAQSGPAKG